MRLLRIVAESGHLTDSISNVRPTGVAQPSDAAHSSHELAKHVRLESRRGAIDVCIDGCANWFELSEV